jgi:acyl-CoA synthetase (AMP-forming)/AMP-acid ligase II
LSRAIELTPGEIDLATLPIFSLANLASGVTTVIPDADLRRPGFIEPAPVLRQIVEHGVTRAVASPALFDRLLMAPDAPRSLASLRRVYTGGAPVFPGLLERLQRAMPAARVVAVYGSTEAEPIAHVAWDEMTEQDKAAMFGGRGLLAGPPVPDIDLRILQNRWGQPLATMSNEKFDACALPANQPGEIVVHGRHVLQSYLGGRDETTKFRVGDAVWHRAGDAGYLDDRGRLWLLGRASARIEDDHGTVYPFAVECAASRVDGVARTALVAHESRRCLVVQPAAKAPADLETQLRKALDWAHLGEVRRLARIPTDKRHNAKIDYPVLHELLARS